MESTRMVGLHTLMFSRIGGALAVAALVASFLFPPEGLGVAMCPALELSQLPCPGCGLTRSVTNISQGNLLNAWYYNPFGYVAWVTFAVMAPCVVAPESILIRLRRFLDPYAHWVHRFVYTLAAALLVFGVIRVVHHIFAETAFPVLP